MFFFPTKCFPRFFDLKKMWAARTCRRTWRAWGCMQHECLCSRLRVHVVSTQSCVNSWPSCLLQCRTYPFSLETAVNLLKQEAGEALLSGNLAGFLVRARKLICCLFVLICLRATNSQQITCNEGVRTSLRTRGSFLRGLHLSILCGQVCDDWSCTSQLHCAGSIAAKHACTRPRIHAISGFKVTFDAPSSHVDLRLPLLDFLGGMACDDCSCASQ